MKWYNDICSFLIFVLTLFALSKSTMANPVEWKIDDGGNGHWYEAVVVPDQINWSDARIAAETRLNNSGYLATSTSQVENDFLFNLISDPTFWYAANGFDYAGPWLGGYQPDKSDEPTGNWKWVTDEPWNYTKWNSTRPEPDNMGGYQDCLRFYNYPTLTPAPAWDDDCVDSLSISYIVEWDSDPAAIPEPATITLFTIGFVMAYAIQRKKCG